MIRIGVIGTGIYGALHLEALRDCELVAGDVELAAFAEVNAETRTAREREYGCRGYGD